MKTHRLLRLLPLLAIASAAADSFELKDGTKFEGTILREEGSDYIIQVQVTKSIKDERRVPKADVVSQVAEKKDETAFAGLPGLLPAPDLLDEEKYAARIDQVEEFLKAFPKSPKAAEARKIHDTLEAERAMVAAGGVKFGGKMVSADERAPKAYALDASIAASAVKSAVEAGDILTALRAWSKLESEFGGSSAYRETIPFMVRVMRSHLANVTATVTGFEARVKARESDLAGMNANDRSRSEQAIKEEMDAYTARIAREKAAGIKWPSLSPYVKAPLDETKRMLDSEIRRLSNPNSSTQRNTEQAYEEAYAAVTKAESTPQEIQAALSKAKSANLPAAYLAILEKAVPAPEEKAVPAAEEEAVPVPEKKDVPATPEP
jgi:hypothetical protein